MTVHYDCLYNQLHRYTVFTSKKKKIGIKKNKWNSISQSHSKIFFWFITDSKGNEKKKIATTMIKKNNGEHQSGIAFL